MSKDKAINNAPVHLDLTGDIDTIRCICGGYEKIDYLLSKRQKRELVLSFTVNHKNCRKKSK